MRATRGIATPLLEIAELRVHFETRGGVVKAVDGVSLALEGGETLAIVGESGSGKSVTAMSVVRLVPMPPGEFAGGDILFKGRSILGMSEEEVRRIRGNEIATIFQDPMTSLNPVLRVGDQVAEPLRVHRGMRRREAMDRAVDLLDSVGIARAGQRARDYPHQLSGGMRQRVMIAMAMACDPEILIADEPTSALDVTIQAEIIELMREAQSRHGQGILVITHDLGVVADIADRVLVMYAGRPIEGGSAAGVFYRPAHPYTWGLHDSLPRHDAAGRAALEPIAGQPPSLLHLPAGCAFHPRCPYAEDLCRVRVPPAIAVAAGHTAACHFAGELERRPRREAS